MDRVTVAMAALLGSSHASCLLSKRVDFSEGGLPAITPPSILETTVPRPNSIVYLEASAAGDGGTSTVAVNFAAQVFDSNPDDAVVARYFVDRLRPCGLSCPAFLPASETVPRDGMPGVTGVSRRIVFDRLDYCHTVDLYVTSQFASDEPEFASTAARTGDIAHTRWYVWARRSGSSVTPDLQSCPHVGSGVEMQGEVR